MPVLDTTRTEGLIGEVISDIVLQLLSYVAEQERAFKNKDKPKVSN